MNDYERQHTIPCPSFSAQFVSLVVRIFSRQALFSPTGGMMISSFWAVSSMSKSLLSLQSWKNCSSVKPTFPNLITTFVALTSCSVSGKRAIPFLLPTIVSHVPLQAFGIEWRAMDRATPAVVAFKEVIDSKLLAPVQRNLFTGELEPVEIEIDRPIPEDETEIDDGISLVKTDDSAQLILSGFGLFLGKKSERLIVRKGKQVIYQFPFFRVQEVVIRSEEHTSE